MMKKAIYILCVLLALEATAQTPCEKQWLVNKSFKCGDELAKGSKWVSFDVFNSKTTEKPDSVLFYYQDEVIDSNNIWFEPGQQSIKIKLFKNGKSCFLKHSFQVPSASIEAGFNMEDSVVCAGNLVKLLNTSGPYLKHSFWDYGNYRRDTLTNPVFVYENNEAINPMLYSYVIMLEVVDIFGCRDRAYKSILVYNNKLDGALVDMTYDKRKDSIALQLVTGLITTAIQLPSKYLWSTGARTEKIYLKKAGYYWLRTEDLNQCWDFLQYYLDKDIMERTLKDNRK